jgi:hypothetical protein
MLASVSSGTEQNRGGRPAGRSWGSTREAGSRSPKKIVFSLPIQLYDVDDCIYYCTVYSNGRVNQVANTLFSCDQRWCIPPLCVCRPCTHCLYTTTRAASLWLLWIFFCHFRCWLAYTNFLSVFSIQDPFGLKDFQWNFVGFQSIWFFFPLTPFGSTDTSGKQGFSPGSYGASVPVAQPGLTNRD